MNRPVRLTITSVIIFIAAPCLAQTVHPAKLKVKGVGLDSTYAQVVRALGKPSRDDRPTPEECIGGREKNVAYTGLTLYFMDGDSRGGKTFELKSFAITTSRWVVSGVKVGDPEVLVRKKFGSKYTAATDTNSGETTWSYDMGERYGPGTTSVAFRGGKVVKIASAYQVC